MSKTQYTGSEIYTKNLNSLWRGSIIVEDNKTISDLKESNKKYILYATGDCDITNGRKYIALSVNTIITNNIH